MLMGLLIAVMLWINVGGNGASTAVPAASLTPIAHVQFAMHEVAQPAMRVYRISSNVIAIRYRKPGSMRRQA